jgi:hypothetical protein
MKIRNALMLSAAVALTAISAGTASSQTSPPTRTTFLTSLPARFVFTPPPSKFCVSQPGRLCPPALVYGGAAGPGLPTIDPAIKLDLPNVRVSFVLSEISNEIIDNGGVTPGTNTFVQWTTTSPAAWEEKGGPYAYSLPPPGITWDDEQIYHSVIYDALVLDACDSFPVFPVTHDALILRNGGEIGAFHGVDNNTLNHTGFYNFNYTARATSLSGRVSDFHFSGRVSVTCTGLGALP